MIRNPVALGFSPWWADYIVPRPFYISYHDLITFVVTPRITAVGIREFAGIQLKSLVPRRTGQRREA